MPVGPRAIARALRLGLAVLALASAACAGGSTFGSIPGPQSHGGPVHDHVSFVDALRAAGYGVAIVGRVQHPFLRPRGVVLQVSGPDLRGPAELQSHDYDDRDLGVDGLAAAQADAAQFQPNGQPRVAGFAWAGPPHVFHKERVLVIYVGDDAAVVGRLTALLGAQIAGQ
jgi:hypothetical protein